MFRSARRLVLAALLSATAVPAQQNLGINLSRGPVTVTGVLCGFDCDDHGPVIAALNGPNRWCGSATASQVIATLSIPAVASGTVISMQGLAFDAGVPAFTRAIELVIL